MRFVGAALVEVSSFVKIAMRWVETFALRTCATADNAQVAVCGICWDGLKWLDQLVVTKKGVGK